MKIYATNKKATFNYEVLETFEAGIQLKGYEVKAVKDSHISLKASFVSLRHEELYLIKAAISKYKKAAQLDSYDPERPRKLLLRKSQIRQLIGKLKQKGLTLVPIKMYSKGNLIKVEIALVRGKSKVDKRETIKKRESDKQIARLLKTKIRG